MKGSTRKSVDRAEAESGEKKFHTRSLTRILRRWVRHSWLAARPFQVIFLLLVVGFCIFYISQDEAVRRRIPVVRPAMTLIQSVTASTPSNHSLKLDGGSEYCRNFSFFLDVSYTPPCRKPSVSIVYVTKRPGGYDMLFHSLVQQTNQDYELICVDELAAYRSTKVKKLAKEMGVHLKDIVPSKPKTNEHKDTKFGIAKALNTGILLASGHIINFCMDFAWIHPRFVERTIEFYDLHPRSFLAYPIIWMSASGLDRLMNQTLLEDPSSVAVFNIPFNAFPSKLDTSSLGAGVGFSSFYQRPDDTIEQRDKFLRTGETKEGWETQPKKPGGDMFWEMAFASAPFSAIEGVNGVEEWLDIGDDCQEASLREHSHLLGFDLWVDYQVWIEQVEHRFFARGPDWTRFSKDTNMDRYFPHIGRVREGREPVTSGNDFNLTLWRKNDCPTKIYPRVCIPEKKPPTPS